MGVLKMKENGVTWFINMSGKFETDTEMDRMNLSYKIGRIPSFIVDDEAIDVVEEALARYQMAGPPMKGGVVTRDGIYKYPDDPDLYPVAQCVAGGKEIFIYEFGIIAFVDVKTKESVVYRFD